MFKSRRRTVDTANTNQSMPRVLGGRVTVWFDDNGVPTSAEYHNMEGVLFKEACYRSNGTLRDVEYYNREQTIKTEHFAEDGRLIRVDHYDRDGEVVRVEHYGPNGEITIG
jgi:hypothetical protein